MYFISFDRSMGMFSSQSQQRGQVFQTLYKTRMIVVKMLILVATFFIISWAPYFALLILEVPVDIAHYKNDIFIIYSFTY